MKVIQLLPVNDTTTDGHWHDSYPYNIVSTCALHPHYVDLEAAGVLRSKTQMTQFLRRRQELNALPYSDYEAVGRVKLEYLQQLFEEQGNKTTEIIANSPMATSSSCMAVTCAWQRTRGERQVLSSQYSPFAANIPMG